MGNAFFAKGGIRPPKAQVAPGLDLSRSEVGVFELTLSSPVGNGSMKGRAASPNLFVSLVDFVCKRCPNVSPDASHEAALFSQGTWMTVNLCQEGRCEVDIPGGGLAIVAAGEVCISCSQKRPTEFRYPSGRYRGIELFINTKIADSPTFSLLGPGEHAVADIARQAGSAAVVSNDADLNGRMERIATFVDSADGTLAEYETLGLLLGLQRQNLSALRPRSVLTRAQMEIAVAVHDEIERSVDAPHDVRALAARFGVSATTLNGYFSRTYGGTVASYLRQRRMEIAAGLLEQGASVATAAAHAGYANPSKFAAVFKRTFGETPRDFRRRQGLRTKRH